MRLHRILCRKMLTEFPGDLIIIPGQFVDSDDNKLILEDTKTLEVISS